MVALIAWIFVEYLRHGIRRDYAGLTVLTNAFTIAFIVCLSLTLAFPTRDINMSSLALGIWVIIEAIRAFLARANEAAGKIADKVTLIVLVGIICDGIYPVLGLAIIVISLVWLAVDITKPWQYIATQYIRPDRR